MPTRKLLSRAAPFFMAFALTRPAWATGIGGNGVDEAVPFYIYAVLLSLACYAGYSWLRRRERERVLRSVADGEPFLPALNGRDGFFGAIQVVVTIAATIGVTMGFLPAVFFPILPLSYTLLRRKHWLGFGLLVGVTVLSVPPFFVFMLVVLSV